MSEQTTQLRGQYREALEQGLTQARGLLADYQRLYPQPDYGQVQQGLATQSGTNVDPLEMLARLARTEKE